MKAIKLIVIVALVYLGLVIAFESLIGYFQPANPSTLVITTVDASGTSNERVLSRLDSDGKIYVAANHWPRAWYQAALANPAVKIALDADSSADYLAVEITGAEHDRLDREHSLGPLVRILTGFPPRRFVRLDPA